jgi:hypothetical protein
MAGRAILWTGMGALPWFWTIPFAWRGRIRWLDWPRRLQFLVWWFLPAFLFSLLIHIGDPGHALISIPAVCLLGGVSLLAAEERFQFRWIPILKERGFTIWISFFASYLLLFFAQEPRQKWLVLWVALVLALLFLFPSSIFSSSNNGDWRKYGPIVSLALLGNLFVFFAEVSLPQRTPTDRFRGWSSVADALRMGTYETSYDRVYWVDQMTDLAIADIAAMKRSGVRPLMVVCSGDGVPAWRKITFYYPSESVYALEERGQPATPASVASLWVGTTMRAQYSGGTPIRLPLPKGTRIVWVVGGGQVEDLARLVPLQKASALYYTDLPYNASSFRWGSFEFTPQ